MQLGATPNGTSARRRGWSNRQADLVAPCNRRADRPDRGPAGCGLRRIRTNDIICMGDQPSAVARYDSISHRSHGTLLALSAGKCRRLPFVPTGLTSRSGDVG